MNARIDIGSLFESTRLRQRTLLRVQEVILGRIHQRIQAASRRQSEQCQIWQTFPEHLIGQPRQNVQDALVNVMVALRSNGFDVKQTHPNLLWISWRQHRDKYAGDLERSLEENVREVRMLEDDRRADAASRLGFNMEPPARTSADGKTKQVRFSGGVDMRVNTPAAVDRAAVRRAQQPPELTEAQMEKTAELASMAELTGAGAPVGTRRQHSPLRARPRSPGKHHRDTSYHFSGT